MGAISPRALDYPQTILSGMIPHEAELTAGMRVEAGEEYGFFTDSSLCIGCKACEVACKEWNALPADNREMTGFSYDNTGALSATTWRHVNFIEQLRDGHAGQAIQPDGSAADPALRHDGAPAHCRPSTAGGRPKCPPSKTNG